MKFRDFGVLSNVFLEKNYSNKQNIYGTNMKYNKSIVDYFH